MIGAVCTGLLVFTRLGGLLATLPGLGAVPRLARMAVAVPLGLVLIPSVRAEVPSTLAALSIAVAGELLVGLAMGLCAHFAYSALAIAGDVAGAQIGLSMATTLDPLTRAQPGVLGVLAGWLATALFFGADLHLACVAILVGSFAELPPGSVGSLDAARLLIPLAGGTLRAGIELAGPLTVFTGIANLGLAVLARMAPGLQLFFAIGPSVTVIAGLTLFAAALPSMLGAWMSGMAGALDAMAIVGR